MKRFSYIIFFLVLLSNFSLAQTPTEIKNVVNKYVKVVSILNASSINVSSSLGFSIGDTVMIIQMKGAIFSSDPNVLSDPGNMGKYELTVIGSIEGNNITFNSPVKTSYNTNESVQLIRVPSFTDAKVIESLTCSTWDGEKGGILVLISSGSLILNANIDVSGKGYKGASPITYSGSCFSKVSDIPYHILNLSSDSASGKKGEGAITNSSIFTMGRGPSGNGGGAGSGSYSGGGGGGNFGDGGNGGKESCAGDNDYNWGGNGASIDGQYFSNNFLDRRIFLGGGGGSGIQKNAGSGSSGGNGGGIVILLTPKIITNSFSIMANGIDVSGSVSDGSSSGGGGGGGMIMLAVDSVINNLNVSAKGGKGGGTPFGAPCVAHGGGGGGGFVWFSGKTRDFSLLDLTGGAAGNGNCYVSSTPGNAGDSLNYLLLPLTGFLNNTIKAGTKICFNTSQKITGSKPQGGNGIYTYQWQYYNTISSSWLAALGKNDSIHYKTSLLTSTTQIRRIVSSDGMNDLSSVLTINVFPQITNNVLEPDTILCFGNPSLTIRGSVAGGGTGNFQYEWSQRSFSGSWEFVSGNATTKDFTISSDVSRYYRRKATSEYCSTYDSVKVEILPTISNNIILPFQTICKNSIPSPFIGGLPEGGTGSNYTFSWQESNDSLNWINSNVLNKDFSNPPALSQTKFYRRLVSSGLKDCCKDTSNSIKIRVLPTIANNLISGPQTICEGIKPALFDGVTPTGGDSKTGYGYEWESSKNALTWDLIENSLSKDYQALEMDTTHFYRRKVYSGLDNCCKSISNEIKITVQPRIQNNIIKGDTTICDNTVPSKIKGIFSTFTGGDGINYSHKWLQKYNKGDWQDVSGSAILESYQPASLTDSINYQRQIISGVCNSLSNIVAINVLNPIQGNVIEGTSNICEGFPSGILTSQNLTGGEPGIYRFIWEQSINGESTWESIQGAINSQFDPGILPNDRYFRRTVNSGLYDCCFSVSNKFKITIDKKPEKPEAGIDRELVYQDTAFLHAAQPIIGSGIWSSFSEAEINDPSNINTEISQLKFGRYAFYWTVTNGVCPSLNDSVILEVSDLKRYTGFSPNGDLINDYFVIEGLSKVGNKDITILNRWGVEVFKSSDYQNNWDGKNKNGDPLPEDTYYYILKVEDVFNNSKTRVYKGYVVIKR